MNYFRKTMTAYTVDNLRSPHLFCVMSECGREVHSIDSKHCFLHCDIKEHRHCKTEHCVFPAINANMCRGCLKQFLGPKTKICRTHRERNHDVCQERIYKQYWARQDNECIAHCNELIQCPRNLCQNHCSMTGHGHCVESNCFAPPEIGDIYCYSHEYINPNREYQACINLMRYSSSNLRQCNEIEIKFGKNIHTELIRQSKIPQYDISLKLFDTFTINRKTHAILAMIQDFNLDAQYMYLDTYRNPWKQLSILFFTRHDIHDSLLELENKCFRVVTQKVQRKIQKFISNLLRYQTKLIPFWE